MHCIHIHMYIRLWLQSCLAILLFKFPLCALVLKLLRPVTMAPKSYEDKATRIYIIYVYVYNQIQLYNKCAFDCVYGNVHICICVCMHMYTRITPCMSAIYTYTYVYIYVCVHYIYIYVYMYMYLYKHIHV